MKGMFSSVFLGCCGLSSIARGATPSTPIRIGEGIGLSWAPFFVATAKQTWQASGLTPTIAQFASGRLVLDSVVGGNVDIGTAADTPVVLAALNGLPVRVIAVFNVEENMELVAVSSIKTAADLAGKKLAYAPGTASHYYVSKLLSKFGVPLSSLTLISLNPPDMASALLGGSIDAFVWQEPQLSLAVAAAPSAVHRLAEPGLNAITAVVLTTEATILQRRDTLVRALRALDQSIKFIKSDIDFAIKTSADRVKMDVEIARLAWKKMHLELKLEKESLSREMSIQAQWAIDNKIVRPGTKIPDFGKFIDVSILEEARGSK